MLLAIVLSLFLSFPHPKVFLQMDSTPEAQAFLWKCAHPFTTIDAESGSHFAKLNFRMLPALAGHLFGSNVILCRLLEASGSVLLLWASLLLGYRITRDRQMAILCCLFASSVFAGTSGFVESRFMFDSFAISLLVFALLFRQNSVLPGMFVFLAAWTDERALVASALVWLYYFLRTGTGAVDLVRFHKEKVVWSVYLAWAGYGAGRWYLSSAYGFETDGENVGISLLIHQLNNLALGLWSGFEGGWILIVCAGVALWLRRQRFMLFLLGLALLAVCVTAFSVIDITRSIAYGLPAFFLCLQILNEEGRDDPVRIYLTAAVVISILWPSLYAGGKGGVWWFSSPVFVMAVRYLQVLFSSSVD